MTAAGVALLFSRRCPLLPGSGHHRRSPWRTGRNQARRAPEPSAARQGMRRSQRHDMPLPNSALALKRKKLKILAIGASSAVVLGGMRDGNPPLLEQLLERTIAGLDVEIVNRGVSGELAGRRRQAPQDRGRAQSARPRALAGRHQRCLRAGAGRGVPGNGRRDRALAQGAQRRRDPGRPALHEATWPRTRTTKPCAPACSTSPTSRTCRASAATRRWRCCRARCASRPSGSRRFRPAGNRLQLHGAYLARVIAVGLFAKPPKKPVGH